MILPQSPFLNKIGTNFVPNLAERLEIHQLILVRQKRLVQLRAELEELESFIDDHLTLVSPIRQVPIDILREIFHCCIPVHEVPVPRADDAPLLFTRVCRLWREVAIDTPSLWNRIHIALPCPKASLITPNFRSFIPRWGDGIRKWLERSGTMPLVFSISGHWDYLWGGDREISTGMEKLYEDLVQQWLSYASRWRILSLDVPGSVRRILTMPAVELSSLTELRSRCHHRSDWEPHTPSLEAVFRSAPSLYRLDFDEPYSGLPIHWSRLTEVVLWHNTHAWGNLGGVTLPQTIQVLSFTYPSLRHCSMTIQYQSNDILRTFSPITLPNLQTLNIHVRHNDLTALWLTNVQQVLDCINAPDLTDFYFGTDHGFAQPYLPTFFRFLERSGCTLRSFALAIPLISSESLIELLTSMPSLKQLKMALHPHGSIQDELTSFIHSLTPLEQQTDVPCPNMESFMFQGCPFSCVAPVLALAEARYAEHSTTCKLKRLQVDFSEDIDEEEVSLKLEMLRKRGMSIKWTTLLPDIDVTEIPRGADFRDYVHSAELWWPRMADP